jgi:cytochrome b subunit of formate dehydrogenase
MGQIHTTPGRNAPLPVEWVQWFYRMMIPGTLAFMALHHAGDFLRKLTQMRFQGHYIPVRLMKPQHLTQRLYLWERIEHGLLMVSFILLAYTGFALHYPDAWWSRPLLSFEQVYPIRGLVHRIAATILVGTAVLHVLTIICSPRLRHHWTELLPRVSDLREMVEGLMWRLGLRDAKPYYSPHGYIEKIEYWALVWGTFIMAVTGAVLWFNNWSLSTLPKLWMDVARAIQYYEAILAAAAILIWHMYAVIFDPDIYPMDPAWWSGYSPRPGHPEDPGLEERREQE